VKQAGAMVLTMMASVAVVGTPGSVPLSAQAARSDYLAPFPAHHVIGNIYFVGSKGLGIYLITTPEGHILVNAGLEESVALIQQSVQRNWDSNSATSRFC